MNNLDMNVTLQHVKQVVECLREGKPIREGHTFDQENWGWHPPTLSQCTTAGCTWGSAYLLANEKITKEGPSNEWIVQSDAHERLHWYIFVKATLDEEEIVERFDEIVKEYPEAFNA